MPPNGTRVEPGSPYPLGATWDGRGANFALFSAHAERVELCIFDRAGRREIRRVPLPEYTDQVWHGYLPDAEPGTLYGYRVYGPYDPNQGHRFNHHKLLIDPYTKALQGRLIWSDAHFGYRIGGTRGDLSFDRRDNARGVPKCVVLDTAFYWNEDRRPNTPFHNTVIYELHTRGFTMRREDVLKRQRGTFSALALPQIVRHFRDLGVTAIELLPIHGFVDDRRLVEQGLSNYWGYNSIAFFAPDPRYLVGGAINEFKTMVLRLHDAGIEVILDVVYNHTAEGNQFGPTLSFRGIDNASYYRLVAGDPRHYEDFTGCGNALNLHHPRVLQLVMDSLRYWVEEMHVDGFRFDLATTLAREEKGFDQHGGFLDAVRQDPCLSRVKLIAEPWDLAEGGYRLGQFSPGWLEWNDRFRDTIRRFWRGDGGLIGEVAGRLSGSADLFEHQGRRPWASVNFVTAHDGFTLHDLVSYNEKHNAANGEENHDGPSENHSWNCGVEGPSDDPEIVALRLQQKRNLITSLMIAHGTPMLLAGDELGNSQFGNNNAYCQDNEIGWVDWSPQNIEKHGLVAFVRRLIALRRAHPALARRNFLTANPANNGLPEVVWLTPEGVSKTDEDWNFPDARRMAFLLNGEVPIFVGTPETPTAAAPHLLVFLNAHHEAAPFVIPPAYDIHWKVEIDTSDDAGRRAAALRPGEHYDVAGRTTVILCSVGRSERAP